MNTVEQLQGLRRNELQSICKTYELRANGKKEVLIELIIEHERSEKERCDASIPSSTVKKSTTTKKLKAVVTPKARQIRSVDEEDELMLGGEELQSTTTTARKGKSVVGAQSSQKSVKEAGLALAGAIGESATTNKSFNDLVSLVKTLQSELETTKAAFVEVSNKLRTVSLPAPPVDIAALQREILSRVDSQLESFRASQVEIVKRQGVEMRDFFARSVVESEAVRFEMTLAMQDDEHVVTSRFDSIDVTLQGMRKEVMARLDVLETRQLAQAPLSSPHHSAAVIHSAQPRQLLAAPLDSPSTFDAPPTRSLTSLSFTPSSPLPEDQLPAPSSVAGLTSPAVGSSPRIASPRRTSPRKSVGAVRRMAPWIGGATEGNVATPRVGGRAAGTPQGLVSGKRARENDDDSVFVRGRESVNRSSDSDGEGDATGGGIVTSEEGRERKRTKVNEQQAESSEEEDSFDASIIVGNKSIQSRDSVIQTKTGEELIASMSTSNPSFFASTAHNSSSASPQKTNASTTGSASRKSLPIASLPFPIVSPFRGKSIQNSLPASILARATAATTVFGDSSNSLAQPAAPRSTFSFSQPSSIHPPRSIARLPAPSTSTSTAPPAATPLAFKTLFGTEKSATRFGDEVVDSPLGATTPVGFGALRRNTPSKPRFGGWGGFGGN